MELEMYTHNKCVYLESDVPMQHSSTFRARLCRLLGRMPDSGREQETHKPVMTERILEYPLLFQALGTRSHYILDFGCVEDVLPIHLASLGHKVVGMDIRPYPFTHPNFTFLQKDIFDWDPPDGEFDAVVSISTIEHLGLGFYGDIERPNGDRQAVEKLLQAVKTGGRLYFTVPAGERRDVPWYRVYDQARLREVFPSIVKVRYFMKTDRYSAWNEATGDEINQLRYEQYDIMFPTQGMAFVVCERSGI